jgi:hypothetical protein
MLKTIARTTDVEPGRVRAFEIREQGAVAAGRSAIPLRSTCRPDHISVRHPVTTF